MSKSPPTVIKMSKNGLEFTNSIDRTKWTLKGLVNGANRDVGKYITRIVKNEIKSGGWVQSGRMLKGVKFRVKAKDGSVKIGYKVFYGGFHELGTSIHMAMDWLTNAVKNNIETIREIQAKYIKSIEDETAALSNVLTEDEEGGG